LAPGEHGAHHFVVQALFSRRKGDRDAGIEWVPANIPFAQSRRSGCLGAASVLSALIWLVWRSAWREHLSTRPTVR